LDAAVRAYIGSKSTPDLNTMRAAWNTWIAKFPNNDFKRSDRYVAGGALDDVAALVVLSPQAQQAQQALVAQQQRAARFQAQYVTKQIQQTYAGGGPISWWVKLTFDDRPTTLIVRPVICCRAKPNDPNGYQPTEGDFNRWKSAIQGAWKAKFLIGQTTKDVAFDIEFKSWDGTTGTQNYTIDIVNISTQSAQEQNLGLAQGSLQAQNWKVKQQAADLTLDGSSMGTPHLTQWGAQDMQAIVHEFGHAIGNPDEYDVVSHNCNFGGHLGLNYNKPGFTTDSIMNDTRKGLIRRRHFAVIAELYRQWKMAQGQTAPTILVTDPPA
jgi:hypothetical protein